MYAPGTPLNQQNVGQTIRPSSTALLTIDSDDRFTDYTQKRAVKYGDYNYSPYNFTITRDASLMNAFATRVAVTEVVFPTIAMPNINNFTNTIQIKWQVGSGTINTAKITLTDGFYNPHALASTLQTAIRAKNSDLSGVNFTYGQDNMTQFIYNNNGSLTLKLAFLPMPAGYTSVGTGNAVYSNNIRQLFDLLGFASNNTVLATSGLGSYTSCVFNNYVDIVCPQLVYNQALKDTGSQISARDSMCRIYLADFDNQETVLPSDSTYTPPGTAPTTIYRNFTNPKFINWTPNQPIPGQLTFTVYDEYGNVLSDASGYSSIAGLVVTSGNSEADWRMTLLISEN